MKKFWESHGKKVIWTLVVVALVVAVVFIPNWEQIRENRAEAQVAEEALVEDDGCTADGEVDPSGNPVVFEDGEQLPETSWVCEAESPNGPFNWVRMEEEVVVAEPAPETEAPPAGDDGQDEPPAPTLAPTLAPAGNENSSLADSACGEDSYQVDGNTALVFAAGEVVATVEFLTNVDNMPTEWLRDREGVCYLYQSGIGNTVDLKVTLHDGGSFAIDGDWMSIGETDLGIIDDSADFRAFADGAGTYSFTASSFGLAVGSFRSAEDKAGFVLADRRNADNGDGRPEYWLGSEGEVVEIK